MSTQRSNDVLETQSAPLLSFGTGEAAEVLGISVRRLQGYVESPNYELKPSEQLGTGRGSRRVFYEEDIYRIGIAEFLARNGFSCSFVSKALKQIDDEHLLGPFNQEGEEMDLVCLLLGNEKNVQVRHIGRDKTIGEAMTWTKDAAIYLLDINKIILGIQKRRKEIQKRMKGK